MGVGMRACEHPHETRYVTRNFMVATSFSLQFLDETLQNFYRDTALFHAESNRVLVRPIQPLPVNLEL